MCDQIVFRKCSVHDFRVWVRPSGQLREQDAGTESRRFLDPDMVLLEERYIRSNGVIPGRFSRDECVKPKRPNLVRLIESHITELYGCLRFFRHVG
ncbi:MAG: hypothetical protein JWO48_273 [Bryobacterales bacterium]|nr:hypothetical protein [Bryobacterales bacterium]